MEEVDIYNTEKHTRPFHKTFQYLLHYGLSTRDSFQLLVISNHPVLTAAAGKRKMSFILASSRCRHIVTAIILLVKAS